MIRKMSSPMGPLWLEVQDGAVKAIHFREPEATSMNQEEPLLELLEQSLQHYFSGQGLRFEGKLEPEGTDFQKQVWSQLMKIPFGETRSYGEIARSLGKPNSSRAVGAANGANPIPILIPCHRVIGSNGNLTGYAGGLDKKIYL